MTDKSQAHIERFACEHSGFYTNGEYDPSQCRACWAKRKFLKPKRCKSRGLDTGKTAGCQTCAGRVEVPLLECAKFGRCSLDKIVHDAACCAICNDREEPADPAGVALEVVPGLTDPLPGVAVDPPTFEYRRSEASYSAHLAALRRVIAWEPAGGVPSRGIVWVGGGKYWPGIVAGVRLLRELGCTLPVEVWHRGECEAVEAWQVEGLGVAIVDMDAMSAARGDNRVPRGDVANGGWEGKLYALTHTAFDQVMFLDADAYCVNDPSPLFDLLTPGAPFAFWSDLPGLENNVKWERVWPEGDNGVPTVQGGQLLIDRRHAAKLLTACHWMCQHSDYYFAHMFGDQDTWRVGLAAGACGYRHLGPAPWVDVAFVCDFQGVDYVVHRCQGKLFRPQDIPTGGVNFANPHYNLPREARVFEHFATALAGERDSAATFGAIYRGQLWGGGGSGAGSDPKESGPYLAHVADLAERHGWRSCVDAGCGDGRVGAAVSRIIPGFVGADAVSSVVEANRSRWPSIDWRVCDIAREVDALPAADALLVKDVLHHWPNDMISAFLDRATGCGRWPFILLTSDTGAAHGQTNTHLGGYRALSAESAALKPFGLQAAFTYQHKAGLLWQRK